MSSFDERKKGFEKKFVHDEQKQFKINAKKNKYLGEWASQILGYSEEKQKQYIQEVIKADFAEAGDEDVYRKLHSDLKDKNIFIYLICTSIVLEILHLIIPERGFEIADLFGNIIGVFISFLIFKIIYKGKQQ